MMIPSYSARTSARRAHSVGGLGLAAALALTTLSLAGASGKPSSTSASPSDTRSATATSTGGAAGPAKNVIILVGDGMAEAQRVAGRLAAKGVDGTLVMDSFPYRGSVQTDPRDPSEFITDSAAAGTALATGVKTYNGAIAVDRNGTPVPSIGDLAKRRGRALGVVTTAQVTDATPAAFGGAHVPDRADQSEIARQFLRHSGADVILGGGEDWWYPAGNPGRYPDKPPQDPTEGSRGTSGNLVAVARQMGYQYVSDAAGLRAARGNKLLGLFANEEMFQQRPEGQGDVYSPVVPLATMTAKAISTLSRASSGFVLLVEEEGIDEFGHNNNAGKTIRAVRELDKAAAVAKQFADANPGTLVVTVGDHETGGMTVEGVDPADESGTALSTEDGPFRVKNSDLRFVVDWTTTGHTAVNTVATSTGRGAERFSGQYENTGFFRRVVAAADLSGSPGG